METASEGRLYYHDGMKCLQLCSTCAVVVVVGVNESASQALCGQVH